MKNLEMSKDYINPDKKNVVNQPARQLLQILLMVKWKSSAHFQKLKQLSRF